MVKIKRIQIKRVLALLRPWKERLASKPKRENPRLTGKPWLDRDKYPTIRSHRRETYQNLLREEGDKQFLLFMQVNYQTKNPPKNITTMNDKLRMFRIRNSLLPLNNTRFAPLEPLICSALNVVYRAPGRKDEDFLEDFKAALNLDPSYLKLFPVGGLIKGAIAGHNDLIRLSKYNNIDEARSALIGCLQNPIYQIVKTLQFPQNNLVKVVEFMSKQQPEAAGVQTQAADSPKSEGEEGQKDASKQDKAQENTQDTDSAKAKAAEPEKK